jgi:hypothetical protein
MEQVQMKESRFTWRVKTGDPVLPGKELLRMEPVPIGKNSLASPDWFLLFILLSIALFAWVRMFYDKYLVPVFVATINYQESFKLFRDKNILYGRFSLGLNAVYIINVALLALFASRLIGASLPMNSLFLNYLLISVLLVLLYLLRIMIDRILGEVSLSRAEFLEYLHNIFILNKAVGLLLLPIIIGIAYLPPPFPTPLIYSGLAIVVAGYLLRILRGAQIFIKNGFSIFYWILYLCALEFLPFALAVKYMGSLV